MSKIIRKCNCEYSLCQMSDQKKHVHVGDECVHPNNIHHKTGTRYVKNVNTVNDIDLRRSYQNWGM